jgi:hypothetical protein
MYTRYGRIGEWGEDGEKLFAFPRNVYPNFSLALDVGRKPLGSRFFAMKAALLSAAAVAV